MKSLWRRAAGSALVAFVALSPLTALPVGASTSHTMFEDAHGIHVVSVTQMDARQFNVSIVPSALERPVNVRVLVPTMYADEPQTRFPVLYLFHGTSGRASDWVNAGGAEQTTQGLPLIVVMPDAGFNGDGGGWFTNWVDTTTALGPSQWETFDIDQLIPWVDANLRTDASRDGRAIAGLSQGGFGAMSYAARHPDMFISAASFSGAPDIDFDPGVAAGATAIIVGTEVGLDGVEPNAMFGSRLTDEINWQGHDPTDLITNLDGMNLWLFTATGLPGPLDPSPVNPGASLIEGATHLSTMSFYGEAQQLGIAVNLDNYTYGTHTFPYWARDLRWYIGPLMRVFAHPPPPPSPTSYESIDRNWSQWGWDVSWQRPELQQFSSLTNGSAAGFTLVGTGTAYVGTPGFYAPGSTHHVTISELGGPTTFTSVAGSGGQLLLRVPLEASALSGVLGKISVVGLPGLLSGLSSATVSIS